MVDCGPQGRWVESASCRGTLTFPQWSMTGQSNWDWVCSSYVQPCLCDRHIKDSVPLIEKSRASCPGGKFPPIVSFIK